MTLRFKVTIQALYGPGREQVRVLASSGEISRGIVGLSKGTVLCPWIYSFAQGLGRKSGNRDHRVMNPRVSFLGSVGCGRGPGHWAGGGSEGFFRGILWGFLPRGYSVPSGVLSGVIWGVGEGMVPGGIIFPKKKRTKKESGSAIYCAVVQVFREKNTTQRVEIFFPKPAGPELAQHGAQ